MTTARNHPSATLLGDGRVLVAAGTTATLAAELYDPASRKWTPTGRMTDYHGPTSVLLQDGRVLVAGGGTGDLYSPATGSWTATGPMAFPYASAGAALLPDGRALFAGGTDSPCQKFGGCQPLADAELYTP
jgi:hypothetical protein